jgi:hypothetical protein
MTQKLMDKTILINQDADILALAQKWRSGVIDDDEFNKLNNWYNTLESAPLGIPDEFTVEKIEKWLHKQFYIAPSNEENNGMRPRWGTVNEK